MNRFKRPPDGTGPLLALFLGGLVAYFWFEIFVQASVGCVEGQDVRVCAREWIVALGPPLGILISAWLIIRQIRISRAQFFPPALEYLDRSNGYLARVRFSLTSIKIALDTLAFIRDEGFNESDLLSTLKVFEGKVDVNRMIDDIARCHLREDIHDECTGLLGDWADCDYKIRLSIQQLAALDGEADLRRPELLRRELAENIPALRREAQALRPRVEHASERLRDVYFRNQRRLVRVGEKVAAEIDEN